MRQKKRSPSPFPELPWKWPVDVVNYDGNPELSRDEYAELTVLQAAHGTSWHKRTYVVLERLLRPLNDVLTYVHYSPSGRRRVIHVLFAEMFLRQRTYWGWTVSEWRETLGKDPNVFTQRHHVRSECRQGILGRTTRNRGGEIVGVR